MTINTIFSKGTGAISLSSWFIEQKVRHLHVCFSSLYHKRYKHIEWLFSFLLLCLSPGSRNMQLTVINFCNAYIVSNLLCSFLMQYMAVGYSLFYYALLIILKSVLGECKDIYLQTDKCRKASRNMR